MSLLKREERSALISMLLRLPNKEKFTVRTNLLSYIPPDVRNNIERDAAPKQDFQNIMNRVDDEEWDHPPDTSYPLFSLLANAIDHVGVSSALGLQIRELQTTLVSRASAWEQLPSTTAPQRKDDLERQIQEIGGFLDPTALRRSEGAVCRIEFEGTSPQSQGTGFLLGPGIACTNFHVMEKVINGAVSASSVLFLFDCVGPDNAPSPGQSYRLASEWLIATSPVLELDFALLRLAGQPGSVPASTDPNGSPRGFLMPKTHDFLVGEPLVVIQHPGGRPRRFAVDRIKRVQPDGTRVAYAADTDYGSSGSPCFTATFDLVALHQGFYSKSVDPEQPNKGIPFNKILEQQQVRDVLR
jgi:hypothetical protein